VRTKRNLFLFRSRRGLAVRRHWFWVTVEVDVQTAVIAFRNVQSLQHHQGPGSHSQARALFQ
jgi:hypothetical protein